MKLNIYKLLSNKATLVKKTTAVFAALSFTVLPAGCSSNTNSNDDIAIEQSQNDNEQVQNKTEQDVIDELSKKYDTLNTYLNSGEVETFKYEINQTLAEMTGFIFYDDPIFGYSLKDLTDAGKIQVSEIWQKTVTVMEEKYPEFTGKVEKGFNSAQAQGIELFNSGVDALDGALESVLGKEVYDSIKDKYNDTVDSVKQKTYDWYQKYNGEN